MEKDFRLLCVGLSGHMRGIPYDNGDLSDLGNEVGLAIGRMLADMTEDEITDFIAGFRHGVSLTNGTH